MTHTGKNSGQTLFFAVWILAYTFVTPLYGEPLKAPTKLKPGFFHNADYTPIVDLINSAQSSLQMEIYEMDDPAVLNALSNAVDRGVKVHVVQEPRPVGEPCKLFDANRPQDVGGDPLISSKPKHAVGAASCADQQDLVTKVNSNGGKYVPFNKAALCPGGKSCFEHGKVTIADDRYALITTGNFNVSNLCDPNAAPATCDRDYTVLTDDSDVISTLSDLIEADIKGNAYDTGSLVHGSASEKLSVGPHSMEALVSFVRSAKESIELENQYLKDPTLNQELIQAAQRGVKVNVVVASECGFGPMRPTEEKKLRGIFQSFDSAGISTRVFTSNIKIGGVRGYLHAKAILVDGSRAWVGSVNGSTTSLTMNREYGIFFQTPTDVKKLQSFLEADFANENGESWEDFLVCAENATTAH